MLSALLEQQNGVGAGLTAGNAVAERQVSVATSDEQRVGVLGNWVSTGSSKGLWHPLNSSVDSNGGASGPCFA